MAGDKKKPWYAAGLAFECLQCGRCCSGPEEGYVWASPEELDQIAKFLGMSLVDLLSKHTRRVGRRYTIREDKKTRDCSFLAPRPDGGKGCSVYPVRPAQCRTWPFWDHNLGDTDDWAMAADRCIGINRGRLFSFEEIEHRRKQTS